MGETIKDGGAHLCTGDEWEGKKGGNSSSCPFAKYGRYGRVAGKQQCLAFGGGGRRKKKGGHSFSGAWSGGKG